MTSHSKSLEDLIKELSPEQQNEVRGFVESLFTINASSSWQPADFGMDAPVQFEQLFGSWDSGEQNSADNERIDADLICEYGSTHEAGN